MLKRIRHNSNRYGIVLLVTMVVLVVLASIAYMLTVRISAQIHRDQYIIDYQNARYACDSALKYTLVNMGGLKIKLIDRPNEPDFSDVFAFTQDDYDRFLAKWAADHPLQQTSYGGNNDSNNIYSDSNNLSRIGDSNATTRLQDMNEPNAAGSSSTFGEVNDPNGSYWSRDPNKPAIPGPYGPQWPLVTAPIELEIGNAKVTIEIEDENAKLPLVWGANSDKDKQSEVDAAITTFCEWMNISATQADILRSNLRDIGQIKTYDISKAQTATADANKNNTDPNAARTSLSRQSRRRAAQPQQQPQSPAAKGTNGQIGDFARLFHSTMLDTEPFAQAYIKTPQRTESALKYMSRWGATKVNVNTAPRQVLEAAFMFGGDSPAVADAIIKARQQHPFTDVNDLQKKIYKYADSIRKSQDVITAASNVFSVKITAVSGVATVSTTAAILRDGKGTQIMAILAE